MDFFLGPTALPPWATLANTPAFQGNVEAQTAYHRLLPLEAENQVKIRLLGWMLVHAPCPAGRSYVASCINSCATTQKILEVADYHLKYFVNCFATTTTPATTGGSTTSSSHPSRPSVETRRQAILMGVQPTPQDQKEAKFHALVRDNCRCVVTGTVDHKVYEQSPSLRASVPFDHPAGIKGTQCSHIIPSYLTRAALFELENASAILVVLERFGGINADLLQGRSMHHLDNVLTLEVSLHEMFDALKVWFVPVEGTENEYVVEKQRYIVSPEVPQHFRFSLVSSNPDLAVPNRQYLAIRAACARVLHMSGAARVIDRILDEREDVKVLAKDGSSAELLEYLLFGAEIMAH